MLEESRLQRCRNKKGGSVSRDAPQPNHLKQNRKTICALRLSQRLPRHNPGNCRKWPKGFTGEKGRPKPPKGPPPTQPVYYETQVSGSLAAANLMQSNQNCNHETISLVVLFNLPTTIRG
jgi:hypothetical protein